MNEYAQLLAGLTGAGDLGEEWRGAFERAPRSAFVPDVVWAPDEDGPSGFRRLRKADEPERWEELAGANTVVVTQLDDGKPDGPGVPTSSASLPALVARMLGHLDVEDGHRVMEVGTGTGWTAALLCARLGDENVTTVELDPAVGHAARRSLAAAGFKPVSVIGDGLDGWPLSAPFDRIHSTAAVQRVPRAWIEQTRPGGVIVTPWGTPYANAGLLRLEVGEVGGPSYGRFVDNVSFMWVRAQRPQEADRPATAPDSRGPSRMDPELASESVHAAFVIGLRVPGARYMHTWDEQDPALTYRMQLTDGRGSWASVSYSDWDDDGAVHQAGPRRLWDEITRARLWWLEEGRPELTRFGITVTADGEQAVWLDSPDHPIT
ncbi:protein-L-isoaspartate(D-aspartate) O-methyltransferase [Kitasatospora sp. NBC_01287]|uniref:methyltransferase domain-containing protein n=1 Tax=Kitasatospora sp. NBC_01287 TaxID=2903573 RepID=UPI002251A4A3|nr:methyltransferase domain-containing protein [Kitasatospora sp. NBC_01287]MCX4747752.1 protein-L-isoaspartate(D-aspartate) O-methyltransferase [Kitasatospora sp. NBC_01287]